MDWYTKLCKFGGMFDFLVERDLKITKEFRDALKLLKLDLTPREIIAFSRFLIIFSIAIFSILAFIFANLFFFIIGIVVGLVGAHFITEYPKDKIRSWALEALSHFPSILIQLIVNLKQKQNLENAISFVAKYGEGEIANDLKQAAKKVWMGQKVNFIDVLNDLAKKWGDFAYGIKRSIYLIVSSFSEKSISQRVATLDRAIKVSLESIRDKIKDYSMGLVLPTLFLFSFGTIIPLVLVSILPVFVFFGASINSELIIGLVLIGSLGFVYFYSNSILKKRPVGFSPIKLPDKIKGVPKKNYIKIGNYEVNAILYTIGIFLVIAFPGLIFLFSKIPSIYFAESFLSNFFTEIGSLSIIWAVGASIAIYSHSTAIHKYKIRKEMEDLEEELGDVSYQLASRISEGRSPEESLLFVSKLSDTRLGKMLKRVYSLVKNQNLTLEKAFFDSHIGVLKRVYSSQVKSVFRIFLNSLKRGTKSAAEALFTLSDHLAELKKIETRTKELMSKSISMMKITAGFFAPAICGVVVILQALIQKSITRAVETLKSLETIPFQIGFLESKIDIGVIEIMLGLYVIMLLYVLVRFASIMESGDDEIGFKLLISRSMIIALFIYSIILIISKIIVI